MDLPDVNVWLALAITPHPFHSAARDWLDTQDSEKSIFFCRSTELSLLRLLTTKAVFEVFGLKPLNNAEAWTVLDRFLFDDRISQAAEPGGIEDKWRQWSAGRSASPKLWMDAWLAAFAYCSGFRLVTTDQGFSQYRGLSRVVLT